MIHQYNVLDKVQYAQTDMFGHYNELVGEEGVVIGNCIEEDKVMVAFIDLREAGVSPFIYMLPNNSLELVHNTNGSTQGFEEQT